MMKSTCPNEETCGVEKTLRIIGAKWTAMILHNLFEGKNRFGELERSLKGISPKTLSVRLRELEQDNIISKQIFAEVPLHVEYSLTEKGKTLRSIIQAMAKWGDKTY